MLLAADMGPGFVAVLAGVGGVASMADLLALRDTGVIAGAISGRALYDGAIDLKQALIALGGPHQFAAWNVLAHRHSCHGPWAASSNPCRIAASIALLSNAIGSGVGISEGA